MDYHSMKRKELQALCKKHNIPANSANSVLADKLSQLLNEKQKPITRQRNYMKSSVETIDDGESAGPKRQAKKVRFSPNNDLHEYELQSGEKQMDNVTETKTRRKSVAKKVDKPVDELIDDVEQFPVKLTRSRVQLVEKDAVLPNNGKKTHVVNRPEGNLGKVTRSKRGVVQPEKDKPSKRSVKDVEKANEPVEEPVVGRVRVTRSRAQNPMDDGACPDVNPQVKQKSGGQVAKDVQPSKEIIDIPVRVTRSRGQTSKEDIGNTVTNPKAEKKRTRREMKATDQSSSSSNVAPEGKREAPKRKSRSRGLETVDEDDAGKVEVVNDRKVTRSKTTVQNSKSEADNKVEVQRKPEIVQQLEEPLQHAGRKNVNRRKSIMLPESSGENLEEPVNRPARRDTRRKFVMQKAQGKGIEKPLVAKRESVKETEMVESQIVRTRKTVGKKQAKEQSGKLAIIEESLEDEENVFRPGKDASENEVKAVANATGSPKPRKRGANPVVEDQAIETGYVSPVDESSRRSTRSKSEGKTVTHQRQNSVAKKQVESSLKTPASSGAIVRGGSSNKRAKLSGTNQSDSEDRAENPNKTPVSKLVNSEVDKKVTKIEVTPVIDGSHKRFTRSAIRSKGKEPNQSAIKEQAIADAQLSSLKVGKFRHDPAVNTAPVRVTRSGIRRGGNAASSLSARVDKKKQLSQSAHRKQPLDDAQMSPPEVAEVGPNPDVTIGVQTNVVEENKVSIIGNTIVMEDLNSSIEEDPSNESNARVKDVLEDMEGAGDCVEKSSADPTLSAAKFETSATTHLTENLLIGKQQNPLDLSNLGDETPSGTNVSNIVTSLEAAPYAVSDGSDVQNQEEVCVKSAIFSEAEVQVAVNSEKSDAYEKEVELTNSESMSKGLQVDVMVEEPVVSVGKTVMEESGDIFGDADNKCDSISCNVSSSSAPNVSIEQSGKSKEMEGPVDPPITEDDSAYTQNEKGCEQDTLTYKDSPNNEHDDGDEMASDQNQVMNEPVSEDNRVHGSNDMLQSPDVGSRGVSDGEHDVESHKDHTLEQSTGDDKLQGLALDDNYTNDDIVTDLDTKDVVADDVVDAGKESAEELDFEGVPITGNDVHEIPILGKSDGVDDGAYAQTENVLEQDVSTCNDSPINSSVDKYEVIDNNEHDDEDERASGEKQLMDEPVSDGEFDVNPNEDDTQDQSAGLAMAEKDNKNDLVTDCDSLAKNSELSTDKSITYDLATDRLAAADDIVDAGMESAKELECEAVPSDSVDGNVDATKGSETDSMPSTAGNMPSDGEDLVLSGDDGEHDAVTTKIKEHEPNLKSLIDDDSETSLMGKDDDFSMTRLFEPTSGPSSANDIIETSFSGKLDESGNDAVEGDTNNIHKELETGLESSNANNILEVPVSGNDVESAGHDDGSEHEPLTSNDNPSMEGHYVGGDGSEPVENDNMPLVTEVVIRSLDQESEPEPEPEQMSNVAVDGAPYDTVGKSASSMSMDAPQTPAIAAATTVDVLEESILETKKDSVSSIFGDIYGHGNAMGVTDAENDSGNEQKGIGTSEPDEGALFKESESVSPGISNEQIVGEADLATENDHVSSDNKEPLTTTDPDLDVGDFMEDSSNLGVDELGSQLVENLEAHENPYKEDLSGQLMGDIEAHESPATEESLPITYIEEESPDGDTLSDLPTSIKEDGRNTQEETQKTNTPVDLGDYGFGMDGFQKSVSANENDDLLDQSTKDDGVSDLQTSARASSSIEERDNPAADFVNPVEKLEQSSIDVVGREAAQDVDMLKENSNENMTEDILDWDDVDSSMKPLFTAPAAGQTSHVKEGHQNAVSFFIPDNRCNEDTGRNETPTHGFDHHGDNESSRAYNDFSLKSLFATPGTTGMSHAKDRQLYTNSFEDIGEQHGAATSAHDFNHQLENESSEVFGGETQANATHGVDGSNYEHEHYSSDKYFEDGQFDMTEPITGEASGLKDDSIGEKKKKKLN